MQVMVEDGDIATWRPFNNTFFYKNKPWKYTTDYWVGVLIQIGAFLGFDPDPKESGKWIDNFTSLELWDASNCLVSLPRNFGWVNVVARHPSSRKDPVPANAAQDPAVLGSLNDIARPSFRPFGVITCWHGPGGYSLAVAENDDAGRKNTRYTFTINDDVDIYQNGVLRPESGQVTAIWVRATRPPDGWHTGKFDPPPQEP
jgi:hypothetical protein